MASPQRAQAEEGPRIAEHHSELPALGFAGRRPKLSAVGGRYRAETAEFELSNGLEELLTVDQLTLSSLSSSSTRVTGAGSCTERCKPADACLEIGSRITSVAISSQRARMPDRATRE